VGGGGSPVCGKALSWLGRLLCRRLRSGEQRREGDRRRPWLGLCQGHCLLVATGACLPLPQVPNQATAMVPWSPVVEVLAVDGSGHPIANLSVTLSAVSALTANFYPFVPADVIGAYNNVGVSE
jgi:hypothetical protein